MSMEPPSGSQSPEAAPTPPDAAPTPPDAAPTAPDAAPTQSWAAAQPPSTPPPTVAWERPEATAGPAPGVEFAPHGARLVAYILDSIIVGVFVVAFVLVGIAVLGSGMTFEGNRLVDVTPSAALVTSIIFNVGSIIALMFFPFFWARGGSTLGMRPFRLRVVRDSDGGRIGWGTALLRLVGLWIAGVVFYIGYIWIFIDKRRRGWQDLIAGTCVIKQD
jgi:uncharacterized RDD family membrane protein YckC